MADSAQSELIVFIDGFRMNYSSDDSHALSMLLTFTSL